MAGETPSAASLKRVDPDGTVTVAATDLRFPNGAVITPDGRTLIVGETMAAVHGVHDRRRRHADRATHVGRDAAGPDGCSLDAEGHIGVGRPGQAVRPDRARREIVEEIIPPEDLATYACMLGGDDGGRCCCAARPTTSRQRPTPVRRCSSPRRSTCRTPDCLNDGRSGDPHVGSARRGSPKALYSARNASAGARRLARAAG